MREKVLMATKIIPHNPRVAGNQSLSYASIGFVRPLWKVVEETDEVGVGFSRFFLTDVIRI